MGRAEQPVPPCPTPAFLAGLHEVCVTRPGKGCLCSPLTLPSRPLLPHMALSPLSQAGEVLLAPVSALPGPLS